MDKIWLVDHTSSLEDEDILSETFPHILKVLTQGNLTEKQSTSLENNDKVNIAVSQHPVPESSTTFFCEREFKYNSKLDSHMETHSRVPQFHREICSKEFMKKGNYKVHVNIHSGHKDNRCDEVNLGASQHTSGHLPIQESFSCQFCEKEFRRKSKLDSHMKTHSQVKVFHCEICSKQFKSKGNLTAHIKIHSGRKDHQCDVCEKVFSRKSDLTRHMNVHTGKRDHQCDVCEKVFSRKSVLTQHMNVHTGKRDHQCDVCEKLFSQKSHLTQHMNVHTGKRDHQCNVCLNGFSLRSDLIRHLAVHTGEKIPLQRLVRKNF